MRSVSTERKRGREEAALGCSLFAAGLVLLGLLVGAISWGVWR